MKYSALISILLSFSIHAMNWDTMSDTQIIKELDESGLKIELNGGLIYLEKGSLTEMDLQKVKKEFQASINEVTQLLKLDWKRQRYKDNVPTLYIYHSTMTGPHIYLGYEHYIADKPAILIPSPVVQAGYAPFFHEFTHIVTEKFWSLSLREGLADFVQFYLRPRQKATMKKSVTDFHSHARDVLQQKSNVLKFIGREGLRYDSIQERIDFYQLSRSFVAYLIHEYGGSRFLELYNNKDSYEVVYNKSLIRLKEDWMKAVYTPLTVKDFSPDPFRRPLHHYFWKQIKSLF